MFDRKAYCKKYLKRWRKLHREKQHPKGYKPERKTILGVLVKCEFYPRSQ